MGNIVVGSALQRGMAVFCYVLMEAAVPAGCYSDAVNDYQRFLDEERLHPTPDTVPNLGYRLYLQLAQTNVTKAVNFYNVNDFALATGRYPIAGSTHWEQNQISFKPNANLGIAFGNRTYAYDSGPPSNPYPIGLRCFLRDSYPPFNQRPVIDIHESMAYVARPRSKAIGAEPRSEIVFPISISLDDLWFGGSLRIIAGNLTDAFSRL